MCVRWCPGNEHRFASCSYDGTFKLWDERGKLPLHTVPAGDAGEAAASSRRLPRPDPRGVRRRGRRAARLQAGRRDARHTGLDDDDDSGGYRVSRVYYVTYVTNLHRLLQGNTLTD